MGRGDIAREESNVSVPRAWGALVVANVSRLTRSVAFLSKPLAADVEIRFVDLPSIEGPVSSQALLTTQMTLLRLPAFTQNSFGLGCGERTEGHPNYRAPPQASGDNADV